MRHTANPITTAIRSWALRSPARLALGLLIIVVALVAIRGVITAVTGGTVSSATETVAADEASSTTPAPSAVAEVTESEVLGLSSTSVTDTPARAAMFYAHVFLDTAATPTQWTVRLSTVTDPGNITDRIAGARPTAPVTILGPTRTTRTAGEAGTRVEIDTSAGTLTATLTETDDRWQLKSPLPTIDLTALPAPSTTTPRPATTLPSPSRPATTLPSPSRPATTSAPVPPSTTPAPAPAIPSPPSTQPAPTLAPAPVPGPIPIPDLDTPLPGARP
ncbi:hypothetical protein BH92_27670 (plasmid) [Rhodococcoides fascians A21d2]|uniref:hypothetical protein n=1 Tax=Rhodococcoides fascians TaxID=1828 RepID=UPI0005612CC4|nr:hypothetical protein [Rhodococcus fascians]QII03840.1 hypothetical protein BH92_27670 [Rhodococcus fascians A21d2]